MSMIVNIYIHLTNYTFIFQNKPIFNKFIQDYKNEYVRVFLTTICMYEF